MLFILPKKAVRTIATIKTAIQINDMMSKQFRAMNMAMATVIDSFQTLDNATGKAIDVSALNAAQRELQEVESNFNQIENEIRQANEQQQRLNNNMRNGTKAADRLWSKMKGIAATYLGFQSAKGIIGLSDQVTNTTARLNMINDELQTTAELQQMILESANRSRGAYLGTASAVAKLGTLASDAFSNNQEIIAFTELMNKNFVIGGSSLQEQAAAMYQLTQAMAAGRLQGDEFRSIRENAPLLAKSIEDYMKNVMKAEGSMKDWSAEGMITADVIKNAMFSAAEETNAAFEKMPYTFGQVWNLFLNNMYQIFDPLIQVIGAGAQWIYDNWSTLEPLFWGLVSAVGAYVVALGIQTTATWAAKVANDGLKASMLANPFLWIALAIGFVVAWIYKWVQSVGGIEIAWKIAMNQILTAWDITKIGLIAGFYWVLNEIDKFKLGFKFVGTAIQNFMGDMKAGTLMILQNMVNGAIGIINDFITSINKIPGVSIDLIGQVSFGTTAQIENEAKKQARNAELANYATDIASNIAEHDASLKKMQGEAIAGWSERQAEINAMQEDAANQKAADSGFDFSQFEDLKMSSEDTAGNTKKIADSVNMTGEDIKYLKDIAEREAINRYTTGEIKVDMRNENHINSDMDIDGVIDRFGERVEEVVEVLAESGEFDV